MSFSEVALALFSVVCSTFGQISFKAASVENRKIKSLFLGAGLCLMLISVCAAALVLRTLPLSSLVPFAALAYITTPCAALLIFREHVRPTFWLGTVFIVCGVGLTFMRP